MNKYTTSLLAILMVGLFLWVSSYEHSQLKEVCSQPGAAGLEMCRGL